MTPAAGNVSNNAQLPRYKCHKEVWAVKIAEILRDSVPKFTKPTCRGSYALGSACGHCERCEYERRIRAEGFTPGAAITPSDPGVVPFRVAQQWLEKHNPEVGGYVVIYADGYISYSPAKAFEEGYTRVA